MPRSEIQKAAAAYRQSIDNRERAAVRATLRAYRLAIAHADARIEQLRAGLEARPSKEWRSYAIQQQERLRDTLEKQLTIAARSSGKEIDTQRVNAYADANKITRRAVGNALTAAGHAEVATAFQGGISERAINAALAQLTKKSAVTDMLERHSKAGAKAAADRLITAVATGENPRKITGSIRASLQHESWKALRIARTEIIRAHTAGAMDLMRENPDITPMYEWVAETGAACAACLAEHGTISPVKVDPARHVNCFPAGTEVSSTKIEGVSTRWYTGELVDIKLASGRNISVTPNHPMLTAYGWVAAGELNKLDDVISCSDAGRLARVVDPDNHQIPALIEEVAVSFARSREMTAVTVPLTPVDFHGDVTNGDVAVVYSDRFLGNTVDPALGKHVEDDSLVLGIALTAQLARYSSINERFDGTSAAAYCVLCGTDTSEPFGGRCAGRGDNTGFAHRAATDTTGLEAQRDNITTDTEPLSDGQLGFARLVRSDDSGIIQRYSTTATNGGGSQLLPLGWRSPEPLSLEQIAETLRPDTELSSGVITAIASDIKLDRVVCVSRRAFSGHVFNLETSSGWYSANGIITHNCKCVMLPIVIDPTTGKPLSQPEETGQDVIDRMSMSEAKDRFGIRRGALLKAPDSNRVPLADMVRIKHDKTWGDSVAIVPLKELVK